MCDFGLFWIRCLEGFSDKFAAKIISVAILSRSNHKMTGLVRYKLITCTPDEEIETKPKIYLIYIIVYTIKDNSIYKIIELRSSSIVRMF